MSARRLLPLALVTAALAAAPGAGVAFADQAPAPHAVNGKPVTGKSLGRLNWTADELVFVLERKKP